MAWRSSGSTHTEMVDNLKRNGLILSSHVERGFRQVDRKYFVPKGNEDSTYSDQPLKEGNIHISAPHIYSSVLEALELQPDSSLSFLNIGSGTGYLSCIVAAILGPKSLNFGVELQRDVIEHCEESITRWKDARCKCPCGKRQAGSMTSNPEKVSVPHIEILHGNGLQISSKSGESIVGFDRIYIGAAVDSLDVMDLKQLLSPGGVLVGPVDDELVKVVRIGSSESFKENCRKESDFTTQIISGVRFAPLLTYPCIKVTIPARAWKPNIHTSFPISFQKASMQLLMCSNAEYIQSPNTRQENSTINLAAILPRDIWIHVLSFTHRKWFEPEQSELDFLKMRLREEQANAERAHQARIEAESKCHVVERERDIYRILARRWQSRLRVVLDQQRVSSTTTTGDNNDSDNVSYNEVQAASLEDTLYNSLSSVSIFGLGSLLQQIQNEMDDSSDEEDDNDSGHFLPPNNDAAMEEVERSGDQQQNFNDELDENESIENAVAEVLPSSLSEDGAIENAEMEERTAPTADTHMMMVDVNVRQSRTVSISTDDF